MKYRILSKEEMETYNVDSVSNVFLVEIKNKYIRCLVKYDNIRVSLDVESINNLFIDYDIEILEKSNYYRYSNELKNSIIFMAKKVFNNIIRTIIVKMEDV